jgi:predicted ATPase
VLTVGSAVLELLAAARDTGPTVLLVDDAQWADVPSLHAIAFAFRRLRVVRVLGTALDPIGRWLCRPGLPAYAGS